MKIISCVAVLLVASAGLAVAMPPGWKVLTDKTKNCQISVPPDWIPSQLSPSMADAPDNKSNVVMHGTNQGQALSEAKSVMQQMFPPTSVMEDSKSRLWYAYKSARGGSEINWYVGIPSKGNVCGAQIAFSNPALEPIMKQIAESLAPAK